MKKLFLFLISCLLISLNIQAQTANITGVKLSENMIILPVNSADTALIAHVLTENEPDREVSWIIEGDESLINYSLTLRLLSDDTIFTFSSKNVVGDIKIIAETSDISGNFKDTCDVRIVIPADEITLNHQDTIFMYIDDDTNDAAWSLDPLIATISPIDATEAVVIWENLSTDIVGIDTTGNICHITALKRDTAKIVAKVCYEYDPDDELFDVRTDTCVIVVLALDVNKVTISGLETNGVNDDGEYILLKGDEFELTAHLLPDRGISKEVIWTRSDPGIISTTTTDPLLVFDTIRHFTAIEVGYAEIVAISRQTYLDNQLDNTVQLKTDTVKLRVYGVRADGMSLNYDTIRMNRTETAQLTASVTPANTTDKTIDWSIFGPENITLTQTPPNDTICAIEALWSDTTKIVAISLDNDDFKDTCVVVVYVPVDSVVIKINNISVTDTVDIALTNEMEIIAVIYPDSATVKAITWDFRDPTVIDSVYSVDDSICHIRALHVGEAEIYAIASDWDGNTYKDTCVFTVDYKPITGFVLNMPADLTAPDSVNLFVGEERELTVTVKPLFAANDSVIWSSNNSSVVNIITMPGAEHDTICQIEAVGEGEAKIFVASKTDPANLVDSCVFTVFAIPVDEVVLPDDSIELYKNRKTTLIASVLPWNASDKSLTWSSSHPAVVEILSAGNDTICEILAKGIGEAKIYAVAHDGDKKDSCVVTVKEQFIFLETDTTHVNGGIELSLLLPSNGSFTASFELRLPKGFGLTKGGVSGFRTSLSDNIKDIFDLAIEYVNDSTYLFTITPKAVTLLSAGKTKIMDIVYTIYDTNLENSNANFIASIVDVVFTLSNETTIEENEVSVLIKSFKDPTGNETVGTTAIFAYFYNNRLFVNTDKAETVSVYTLNGTLLFTGNKKEGQAIFNLETTEQVLIVGGGSGWANKVFKK